MNILMMLFAVLLVGCGGAGSSSQPSLFQSKAELGAALFADKNLSRDRNQSCASCHNPEHGFIDNREDNTSREGIASAGSLGDNLVSVGDRNAPTASYALLSPSFHQGKRSRVASQRTSGIEDYEGFIGGQFWDGRALNLQVQAGGPPLNPDEMNMPDQASVVQRIKENADYVAGFELLYGINIFDEAGKAYIAITESIAAFEETLVFAPFDSKYDRSLVGDYDYAITSQAALGKVRFFSSDLTCAACHQLRKIGDKAEPFTSFEFHNIGVPENTALREVNGVTTLDEGLLQNPAVTDMAEKGKFKVPTLRNVAVTAPYMHNGVFNELETVIKFYQHAKTRALGQPELAGNEENPETYLPWRDAEINQNIEHDLLGRNHIDLTDNEVEAMVCFLMSLTDKRYEHLLEPEKVNSCGL